MNNKYEQKRIAINKLIKQMNQQTGDNYLTESLFGIANLKDCFKYTDDKNKLVQTRYSNISLNQLYNLFDYKTFNFLTNENKEMLFQEVYNRLMDLNDLEKRYICTIENIENLNTVGYIKTSENKMVFNKNLIETAINSDKNSVFKQCIFDKYTVGPNYMLSVLHETQHNIQSDKAMDLVLGLEKDEDVKAMSAIALLFTSIPAYCHKTENNGLYMKLRNDYKYMPDEHDANFTALNTIANAVKISKIEDVNFLETIHKFAENALYIDEYSIKNNTYHSHLINRANKMEEVLRFYLNIAKKEFANSHIKNIIVSTIEDYIKNDEFGTSKFKGKMLKDMNKIAEICNECFKKEKQLYSDYFQNM